MSSRASAPIPGLLPSAIEEVVRYSSPAQFVFRVSRREAERLDVGRAPNPHLGLDELLARVDAIELASDAPWEPRRAFHVHGPIRLPIRFEATRR